jgi:exo-beta-1,3-glucanase (GH17 family)
MSFNRNKIWALTGFNAKNRTEDEIISLFHESLKEPMHGLCFSPYENGQKPGDQLSEEQVRRRLEVINPHTNWVRSFSCTEGNELIPKIAHEMGLKTLVGAWLGKDKEINEKEISGLIQLAKDGYVDIAVVGNEVLYRKDLTMDELLQQINRVKKEIPGIEVGYVDAYYEFENHPELSAACDVILANCYPFWEGCSIEYSLPYMKDMYGRAKKAGKGKKVIITETGWPNQGAKLYGAEPSKFNALTYFLNAQAWSKEDDIEMFYFSSFDESWKADAEGDVGPYWGLWDSNEKLKY